MRDIKKICIKLRYAMLPSLRENAHKELRNCNQAYIQGIYGGHSFCAYFFAQLFLSEQKEIQNLSSLQSSSLCG